MGKGAHLQKAPSTKPTQMQKGCPGVKKFGIDIAGSVSVLVHNPFPFARVRDNSPNDIIYFTAGRDLTNRLFDINASVIDGTSLTTVNKDVEHGVIQNARPMRFEAEYSGGQKAYRVSPHSRDAQPFGASPPWVRTIPQVDGSPRLLGDYYRLWDRPQHFFPKEHPKHPGSELRKIKFNTVLDFWHVAKEKNSDGTKQNNLAFLSNFQITCDAEAVKSTRNDNFVGNQPNNRITRAISCGKGSVAPVLDTPLTINELNTLHT